MQNKRQEQQYMGNRHNTSQRNFTANNTPGQYRGQTSSPDDNRNYKRDFNSHESNRSYGAYGNEQAPRGDSSRFDHEDKSQFKSQYGREDYLSDYSRPYSEGVASYSRPYSSDSEYLGQDTGYSSRPDTYSSSYPHQQSYGQGNYSAVNNTDRGISRKEGYGQYPQQNWKNTNEGQWQTSQDSSSSKSFFGKGPKGFKRSDERIKEEVCEALYRDHSIDASEIDVAVQGGEITLTGTVTERRMKRLAEDCVEAISGVTDVRNEIKVQSASSERSFGSDDSTYADKNMDRNDKTKNRTGLSNKVM